MNRAARRAASGSESVWMGRAPVAKLSAQELWDELVADAVGSLATPPNRFMPALAKIAAVWKKKPDDVFRMFGDAVRSQRGDSRLPGTSPDYRTTNPVQG